nr:hypothetical protein CFP56_71108 [Quercus suber]
MCCDTTSGVVSVPCCEIRVDRHCWQASARSPSPKRVQVDLSEIYTVKSASSLEAARLFNTKVAQTATSQVPTCAPASPRCWWRTPSHAMTLDSSSRPTSSICICDGPGRRTQWQSHSSCRTAYGFDVAPPIICPGRNLRSSLLERMFLILLIRDQRRFHIVDDDKKSNATLVFYHLINVRAIRIDETRRLKRSILTEQICILADSPGWSSALHSCECFCVAH